jgi:hypothetical protein
MRWDDEPYVRLYKRETPEWCLLSWQARALFYELLKRVDMAGLLMVGKSGIRGLAGLVRMPLDVVQGALYGEDGLLADGCVVEVEGGYIIPNYVEAQQAKQSDRVRKAEQRARDRAAKLDEANAKAAESRDVTSGHALSAQAHEPDTGGHPVTNRDTASRSVTNGHERSRGVTVGHSELSEAKLSNSSILKGPSPQLPTEPGASALAGGGSGGPNETSSAEDHPGEHETTLAILAALKRHPSLAETAHLRFARRIAELHCAEHSSNMTVGKSPHVHPLVDVIQCIDEAAEAIELDEAASNQVNPAPQRRVAGFVKSGPRRRPTARGGQGSAEREPYQPQMAPPDYESFSP